MNKSKQIFGAVAASTIFGIFLVSMLVPLMIVQFTEEALPISVYIFLLCIFGIPLLAIIITLISRIKEILGGEEDEASKY